MERNERNVAFWLMPAANERRFFETVIRDLSLRFDAPIFEPHLTLHSGVTEPSVAADALKKVPTRRSYYLEVKKVDFSDQFTKTLFVRFQSCDALSELRAAIGSALRWSAADEFDPHLSLIYKELPLAEKAELARTVELPFQTVTFDALAAITHPAEIKTRQDVEAWRHLGCRSLAAG